MGLSALIANIERRRIDVVKKTNLRKYYNVYPNVIRLETVSEKGLGYGSDGYKLFNALKEEIKKFPKGSVKLRREWYTLGIFCMDVTKTLRAIDHLIQRKIIREIIIETMPQDIIAETSIRPDLPRAHTVVVNQLPHEKYRYRVYWPATVGVLKNIGAPALEAIVYQIDNDPTCKPLKPKTAEHLVRMGYQYGARYFYTTGEDIFSIIGLINPKFINRIEKFITIEELNEKNSS
jgi:hypothetical protein